MAKPCKWCEDNKPEWSYDAKVWIHRRERLDRRCENPPNDYGYTTQVPEETISQGMEQRLAKITLMLGVHIGTPPSGVLPLNAKEWRQLAEVLYRIAKGGSR